MLTLFVRLLLAGWLFALPADASEFSGTARIVDGDTLNVGGQKIRIEGIDAFETSQSCFDANGGEWQCGQAGTAYLLKLTRGKAIRCSGGSYDGYDRLIATCFAGQVNLGAAMVESGLALVFAKFSDTFVAQEQTARSEKSGVWSGSFLAPWEYRSMRWTEEARTAPGECPIKGNISANGQIYHTPYSRDYDRTNIDETKGERWFCSESEALAAGWRAPLTN